MLLLSIFQSVEFYVIATVVAAAVVALCIRPSGRGEAQTIFAPGDLSYNPDCQSPAIEIEVRDDGAVVITRHGLDPLSTDSKVTLAITKIGFDLSIQERVADIPGFDKANTATFTLDFLGKERYHISYFVEHTNLFTSASLTVRPGIRIHRDLTY